MENKSSPAAVNPLSDVAFSSADPEKIIREFEKWFPTINSMAEMLAKGDPNVKVTIDSPNQALCQLAASLNNLAQSVQEMVSDSHEMAIGLCEHYDTLNHIASGNLMAHASEDSANELIAKLGQLINRSSDAMLQTIEELRKKDQELTLAYDKLRNIIEFLPDATFVIDREKRVIAWNRAMVDMTGTLAEEIIGKGDFEYSIPFYGFQRPALIDLIDMSIAEIATKYNYIRREGETLFAETYIPGFCGGKGSHIWITATPLFDSAGDRIGAIETVRDISDLKRAQEDNANLLEQLRQSQKMEAVGQLAGGIAHDFNNILTAIVGYGQMVISKSAENSACHRYGEQIVIASERAGKLTSNMLAFSRRQLLDSQPCDLNGIVMQIEEMLQRVIGEDITISVEPCPKALMIMADSGQIQQVLMNLVTNARDAMPNGGQLTIRTLKCSGETCLFPEEHHHQNTGHSFAVLIVSDSGIGMDEETRLKIFEPFYTTKQVGKGTGLGLSMVFGIIGQHGGTISVESTPGQGSVFAISLPLIETAVPQCAITLQDVAQAATTCGETILLVEDNDLAREVISEVLENAGYHIITAFDGLHALEQYRKHADSIDMVLLDVIMPRMNGREALDAIRMEAQREIHYLFMSGYTDDIIHSKGKLEVDLNFIPKPVSPDELLDKVRLVLNQTI